MYIASQICNSDLYEFFQHENQAWPPALSQTGVRKTGTKNDLLRCLKDLTLVRENVSSLTVQIISLDDAANVSMLRPGTAKTFLDCDTDIFMP